MKLGQTFIATLCLFVLCFAAAKPNLSGTWKLDKDRSIGVPGLEQTLTIAHTGDDVKVDAKIVAQGREQQINETWALDNQEHAFTPPGAPPGSTGKRKASWLPNGKGVLIEDESVIKTPNGDVPQRTTRKYTLSADGATLIVDYYIDRPGVSAEAKRVFTRQ